MILITLFLMLVGNLLAVTHKNYDSTQNIDSSLKSLQKEDFDVPSLEDIVKQSLCSGFDSNPEICQDMEKKFSSLGTKEFSNLYRALPQKPPQKRKRIAQAKVSSKISILHDNRVLLDEAIKDPLINKEEKEKKLKYYEEFLKRLQKDFESSNDDERKEKLKKNITHIKGRVANLLRTSQETDKEVRELQQKITTLREKIKENKQELEDYIPKVLAFSKDLKWIDHKVNGNPTGYQVAFIGMSSPRNYRTPMDSSPQEYHNVIQKIESLNEQEEDPLDGKTPWQRKTPFLVSYRKLLISPKKSFEIFFVVAFAPKEQTSSIIGIDKEMKEKANRMIWSY